MSQLMPMIEVKLGRYSKGHPQRRFVKLPYRGAKQRGMVMIMTLLFAVASMILATGAVSSVVQSERMAGNMRSQNLSFQAAEAALTYAANTHLQNNIGKLMTGANSGSCSNCTGVGDFPSSTPLSATVAGDPAQPAYWQSFNWATGNHANTITVQIGGSSASAVSITAYYIVEQLTLPGGTTTVNDAYRITAMSYGDSNQGSMTILQATYTL